MPAVAVATSGLFCDNRNIAMATFGLFCTSGVIVSPQVVYADVGADGQLHLHNLRRDDRETIEIIQVILHSGVLDGEL